MTDETATQTATPAPATRTIARNAVTIGNLTADPELRYTQDQKAVVNFTVAVTDRVRNAQTGEWSDGETTFYRATAWEAYAEHIAASLSKGVRVVVIGDIVSREYDDRNGVRRTSIEIKASTVSVDLRYGTAVYTRAQAGQSQAASVPQPAQSQAASVPQPAQAAPVQQPVAQPAQAQPVAQVAGAPAGEFVF
ncbi:single-stranded DNA-binding protein [Microbacterium enclense]|uniref:single-stranded DNA-binding protein n=1 Tax=Microbacterium enclense TaxID=993073 RepID=UPI003F805CC4